MVSVIVPAFNAGGWLVDCLRSILDQSWTHLEAIVVDDGSSDGSVDALRAAVDDPRLRCLRQPNQGAAAARNAGLAAARGAWLCFVDADDLLHPDKLKRQLSYHEAEPRLEISGSLWVRFHKRPPGRPDAALLSTPLGQPLDPVTWQVLALSQHLMMQPAAWLLRRALVTRAGAWNPALSLNDDGEFFARQMLATHRVGFCPEAISYYRSGFEGNLSGSRSGSAFRSAVSALDLVGDRLLAAESSERTREALAMAWSRLAVDAWPRHPAISRTAAERADRLGRFGPQWSGGGLGRRLAKWLGWRTARSLQWAVHSLGYRRLGLWRQNRRRDGAA